MEELDKLYNMSDEELEQEVIKLKTTPSQDEAPTENKDDSNDFDEGVSPDDLNDLEQPSEGSIEEDNTLDNENLVETTNEDSSKEEKVAETYKVKANGKEFDFTIDELTRLASMGMDYTKKTQEIKPYRAMLNAIKESELTQEDINTLIDIRKGNKEALASLAKQSQIDLFDIPEEVQYTPNNYGENDTQLELKETLAELQQDSEFAQTQHELNTFDEESKQFLVANPQAIRGLHADKMSGVYDTVMPVATKMAIMDGYAKPILEYYMLAGQEYYARQQQEELSKQQTKAIKNKKINENKRNAGLPSSRVDTKLHLDNPMDMSEAEYDEWYKQIMER